MANSHAKAGNYRFQQVQISCWAPGILNQQEETAGNRLCRGLSYYKGKRWNYYGSPIEGILATVNLNTGKIASFVDSGDSSFFPRKLGLRYQVFRQITFTTQSIKDSPTSMVKVSK